MRFSTEEIFGRAVEELSDEEARERQKILEEAREILEGVQAPFVAKFLMPTLEGLIERAQAIIDDPRATREAVDLARGMGRTARLLKFFIEDSKDSALRTLRGDDGEER